MLLLLPVFSLVRYDDDMTVAIIPHIARIVILIVISTRRAVALYGKG
jgi:hypothetical protein